MMDLLASSVVTASGHSSKAAKNRLPIRFLYILPFLLIAFGAQAQQAAVPETLREAIPQPGDQFYYAPYVKWHAHERIPVFVVRDPDDEGCSTMRLEQIDQHIRLIRREIPQLDGLQAPKLVSAIPDVSAPAVVITSPTSNGRVPDRIRELPQNPRRSLIAYGKDQSFHLADGIKRRDRFGRILTLTDFNVVTMIKVGEGEIRFGANWDVNRVGELSSGPECAQDYLSIPLYDILGALNLNYSSLLRMYPETLSPTPESVAWLQRLFLKSLYAERELAPDPASLRATFSIALADALRERSRK